MMQRMAFTFARGFLRRVQDCAKSNTVSEAERWVSFYKHESMNWDSWAVPLPGQSAWAAGLCRTRRRWTAGGGTGPAAKRTEQGLGFDFRSEKTRVHPEKTS